MPIHTVDIAELAEAYAQRHPRETIAFALREYSPRVAIGFSGAEDVVLVHLASTLGVEFKVFALDTGRLHAETYQFLEKVRERYRVPIEVFFPRPDAVEKLVRHTVWQGAGEPRH